MSWQTWEGGLPSGTQPAGDQTYFCTRELGSPVCTGSSISEDTMANRLDSEQTTVHVYFPQVGWDAHQASIQAMSNL